MSVDNYSLGRGVSRSEMGAAAFPGLEDLGLEDDKAVTGLGEYEKMFDKPATGEKFEWVKQCPVEGLFSIPEMWKKEGIQSHILDMSKAKDLKEYSSILNKADQVDPNLVILDEQKQFCQNIENWKVFITTANILYKKIIK
tara:strand:+ start:1478 stop:1900 length:423 start_codon:yes stop_codon:yes gene_type:complete